MTAPYRMRTTFLQHKDPVNGALKYSLLCEERYRGNVFKMDDCLLTSMNDAKRLLKKHMRHRIRASSIDTDPGKASLDEHQTPTHEKLHTHHSRSEFVRDL